MKRVFWIEVEVEWRWLTASPHEKGGKGNTGMVHALPVDGEVAICGVRGAWAEKYPDPVGAEIPVCAACSEEVKCRRTTQ
jgi:hypothetical protein